MTLPYLLKDTPEPAADPRGDSRPVSFRQGSVRWRNAFRAAVVATLLMIQGSVNMEPSYSQPTVGDEVGCLAVGAAVHMPGRWDGPDLGMFRRAESSLGPLSIRRSFDRNLPSSFAASSAAGDESAGLRSFVSWKPPHGDHRGAAAGRYDRQITAWAESVPRTGVFATAFHEPENDMTAAEFVAFQRHVYTVVKEANPTIQFGPVYMAYWWNPDQPKHYVGDPAAWWPGKAYADFAALDWYGFDPTPMTTSRSFATWYETMAPTGLPLLITEYGQYFQRRGQPRDPAKEEARARVIRQDAAWIFGHPEVKAWLYWQAGDASGDWLMRDPASQLAWRSVTARGCP